MKAAFVCLLIGGAAAGNTLAQPLYIVVPLTPIIGASATVDSINDTAIPQDLAKKGWKLKENLPQGRS